MVTQSTAIKTAKSFINDCLTTGLSFHKVLLFGSFAKGTAHEWSDIDLLLISDQFNDNVFENLKLYSKINIKYPAIETHPYSTEHFSNGNPFIDEIRKEGIDILAA